ncbi:MAG: hypothetical protein ABI778_05235 [Ignavibacteriota bacterium]
MPLPVDSAENSGFVTRVNMDMQSYHAEAIVNMEGQIIISLPFRVSAKVDVGV